MKPRLDAIRASRLGHSPVWLTVTVALLLTGAALFGVFNASASLGKHREAQSLAQDLVLLVNSVHDTNAATTGSTPGSELRAAAAIAQLEPAVSALTQIDDSSATKELSSAFGLLTQSVANAEQGLLTGQLDAAQAEAAAAESNRVVIEAVGSARQSIDRSVVSAERIFQIFTVTTFVIVAASLAGLILKSNAHRKAGLIELTKQENRFRTMLQHSGDLISLVDRNGNVQSQSSSMLRLLGRSDFWLTGRAFVELVHESERPLFAELIRHAVERTGEAVHNRLRLAHGDGSWRAFDVSAVNLLNQPELDGVLLTCRLVENATPATRMAPTAAPVHLQHPVSGLLSEPFFRDRLQHALIRSARNAGSVSLLVVELGPKEVIAALSEDARSAVLRTIGGRLARSIRSEDSAAHLDGLELAIILEEADINRARSIAGRVNDQIQTPVSHLNGQVKLTSQIGIAVKSDPRDSVETLLLDARTSLRSGARSEPVDVLPTESKPKPMDVVVSVVATNGSAPKPDSFAAIAVSGGNAAERVVVAPVAEAPVERIEAEPKPDRVFDPSAFEIQFVPVLALQTGEIVELEAVARWRQPQRGLVPIEASGIADLVTPWVFERACAVAQSLPHTRSGRRVRVSVNITPATPLNEMLVDGVAGILLNTGVDPSGIQLEIPARMLDERDPTYETAIASLRQLRELGICLAVDGSGADVDRLPDFSVIPANTVKIDRSVVSLLDRSADRRALVREIVERAQPFGITVTGTGVETLEQAERLWDLGADHGQGPLFFKSITEEQLEGLFTTESATVAAD